MGDQRSIAKTSRTRRTKAKMYFTGVPRTLAGYEKAGIVAPVPDPSNPQLGGEALLGSEREGQRHLQEDEDRPVNQEPPE